MKIIIAGEGKFGTTLTRRLSAEGHDITLIDKNQDVLDTSLETYDILTVLGNCASYETLVTAGVAKADVIISATASDEVNLLCTLTAKHINPNIRTIARIRSPEYSKIVDNHRDLYGLDLEINPEKATAIEMDRIIKYPGFPYRETFIDGRVEIVEVAVKEDSVFCDEPLHRLPKVLDAKVLVCCVVRNGEAIIPDGGFVLRGGDRIYITAPIEVLSGVLRKLKLVGKKLKNVLIVGGGRISFYLAHRLERSGVAVTIIEKNNARATELYDLVPTAKVICDDASDPVVLDSANISGFDAVVTATGLDELNIITSLYAGASGVEHLITKIGRDENRKVLNTLPIGSILCPKEICAATIVQHVRGLKNQVGAANVMHFLASGQMEASEFTITEHTRHLDTPLSQIKTKNNVLVACIRHKGAFEIPGGSSTFSVGDKVVVVTNSGNALLDFNDIFAN